MESASLPVDRQAEPVQETGDEGLKKDAIGFVDGLSVGLASTAPAYSLAAVIGSAPALARAREAGVDATLALVPKRPTDALISLAEEHDARAIVVGTHGETPIRSAILGSTPHKLLHLSRPTGAGGAGRAGVRARMDR